MGYGGWGFLKDLGALQAMAKAVGYETPLLEAIETINERQKKMLTQKITSYFAPRGGLSQKTIAIWGLSFKPNTDDIREAPALQLIEELLAAGAILRLYDPIALENVKKLYPDHPNIIWCETEYHAAEGAEGIALVTEWKQFRFIDLEKLLSKMQGNAFFDGRNQHKASEMQKHGFHYFGIGV